MKREALGTLLPRCLPKGQPGKVGAVSVGLRPHSGWGIKSLMTGPPQRRLRSAGSPQRLAWVLGSLVGASELACSRIRPPPEPSKEPHRPAWMAPRTPNLTAIPGTTGLSARSCGECHAEIYAEWKSSTHAHAWSDAQFQAELRKDPEVAWICINCHTPLSNQQASLVAVAETIRTPEVRPNPSYDAALRDEGVTCLTCHWREQGIAAVHEDVRAPHPTVFSPDLRSEDTCTGCHQAVARLEDTLVCSFNTGAEWEAAAPGKTCSGCHMPSVQRPSAAGAPARAGGRHTFPGSLIPKDLPTEQEAALMAADWQAGVELELTQEDRGDEPPQMAAIVSNRRAGHRVPTGDPERYLELTLTAVDAEGVERARSELRIGQQWEWWPEARKLSDNRLGPGESHRLTLDLPSAHSGLSVSARLDHVRMRPENASYHNLDGYPTRRLVDLLVVELPPLSP